MPCGEMLLCALRLDALACWVPWKGTRKGMASLLQTTAPAPSPPSSETNTGQEASAPLLTPHCTPGFDTLLSGCRAQGQLGPGAWGRHSHPLVVCTRTLCAEQWAPGAAASWRASG